MVWLEDSSIPECERGDLLYCDRGDFRSADELFITEGGAVIMKVKAEHKTNWTVMILLILGLITIAFLFLYDDRDRVQTAKRDDQQHFPVSYLYRKASVSAISKKR